MPNTLPRRNFIKTTGLAAVSSLAGSLSTERAMAQDTVTTLARLLPGCCAYSYGAYLQKQQMTMEDFMSRLNAASRMLRTSMSVTFTERLNSRSTWNGSGGCLPNRLTKVTCRLSTRVRKIP